MRTVRKVKAIELLHRLRFIVTTTTTLRLLRVAAGVQVPPRDVPTQSHFERIAVLHRKTLMKY